MNLPNKLSVARVLCIPAILGCITDFLDGKIARSRNLVTDFGKFIDPVADKLLVLTTLIMLIHLDKMDAWIVILILCRELAVDGLRMVAVGQGRVIAAGPLGKVKTVFQMLSTIALLVLVACLEAQFDSFNALRQELKKLKQQKEAGK